MSSDERRIVLTALAEVAERVGRRSVDDVVSLFEPGAVLLGTARANRTPEELREYLAVVLGQPDTLSWEWDESTLVVDRAGDVLWFSLEGDAISDVRQPMRLTGVLRADGGDGWRWSQFHGSVAQDG